MTAITPDHRHSAPAMDSVSSTAAEAPSMAAAVTSPSVPQAAPHTSDAATISVHVTLIAMRSPPFWESICGGAVHYLRNHNDF